MAVVAVVVLVAEVVDEAFVVVVAAAEIADAAPASVLAVSFDVLNAKKSLHFAAFVVVRTHQDHVEMSCPCCGRKPP